MPNIALPFLMCYLIKSCFKSRKRQLRICLIHHSAIFNLAAEKMESHSHFLERNGWSPPGRGSIICWMDLEDPVQACCLSALACFCSLYRLSLSLSLPLLMKRWKWPRAQSISSARNVDIHNALILKLVNIDLWHTHTHAYTYLSAWSIYRWLPGWAAIDVTMTPCTMGEAALSDQNSWKNSWEGPQEINWLWWD